ncbi:tRNA (adenine(58)-N(1))-methyltransferase, mitochondrial [Salarias fasciatus]|uniref:tRNA (adenine(58)-N(1))-methyltransferase n=1 Tax=Salarias fasciatus TaxID=181472 RepID=A0A672HSI2_SALFA|nr:tRNA (adenine(58)-N(1))-methyltransferase, mitochondrial [Salarias fasciatus]
MAVHVSFRLVLRHRLVTVCRHRDLLHKLRLFSTVRVNLNENDETTPDTGSGFRRALLSRSRRHLSPLERVSSMLPPDALSPEVLQLREQTRSEGGDPGETGDPEDDVRPDAPEETRVPLTLPGESLLAFGELLVAEYRKKRVEFRKMFELQPGARLHSNWGVIPHDHVAGQPAGRFFETNRGVSIFIRRASLEDYVLYMKRGPAIAYPKDSAAMLMMMDVMEGDCVLESGSGSGAMSLFLSRAVGSKGSVLSVEVREDHHKRSMLNYQRWRKSWSRRRGQEWPDNVQFHNADLRTASSLLAGRGFHGVALDMINPHVALPTVTAHLHPGAVCAVYLANITQVVDLLEGLRWSTLPLLCERIIEVPIRDWLVSPAREKDGRYRAREPPIQTENSKHEGEASDEADREELTTEDESDPPAFGTIPYVARPHPEQMIHTAFLVKLRKCER